MGAGLVALAWSSGADAADVPETPDQIQRYGTEPLTITLATRTGHYPFLIALVSNPGAARSALVDHRRIDTDEGILYIEDNVQPLGISNQSVPYPTDLLFATADGEIVEVHPNIMADDARVITSIVPVKAALQVIAGTIARTSAAPGDYLLSAVFGRTL